jgi:signal peptidase I
MVAIFPHVGLQGVIVTSGSMTPNVAAGDLIVIERVSPARLDVGDIITFHRHGSERLTTHRILSRHVVSGRQHFRTKGDANDTPDADLAPADAVVGRAVLTIPQGGRALALLRVPEVRILVLGVPSLWLALRHAWALRRALGTRRQRRRSATSLVTLIAIATFASVDGREPPSLAVLHHTAAIAANSFTTGNW